MSETPIALDRVTADDFAAQVGTAFTLPPDDAGRAPTLTLIAVRRSGLRFPSNGRESFSLEFDGPPEIALPQGTYALSHPEMGTAAIFLVPIRADAERRGYEAIFS